MYVMKEGKTKFFVKFLDNFSETFFAINAFRKNFQAICVNLVLVVKSYLKLVCH